MALGEGHERFSPAKPGLHVRQPVDLSKFLKIAVSPNPQIAVTITSSVDTSLLSSRSHLLPISTLTAFVSVWSFVSLSHCHQR